MHFHSVKFDAMLIIIKKLATQCNDIDQVKNMPSEHQNQQDSATRHTNADEIVGVAKLCAGIILENGGETYRAEETAYRICNAFGFDETDVFATPTGVFITVLAKMSAPAPQSKE